MLSSRYDSPRFGQHYSAEEIIEIFAPAKEAVNKVWEWVESSGIDPRKISLSANKQWLQFDATADEANKLFKTEYNVYEHSRTGNTNIGCDEYHVPAHIKEHIDYVTPGLKLLAGGTAKDLSKRADSKKEKRGFRTNGQSKFSPPIIGATLDRNALPSLTSLASCDQFITPNCISAMYNITKATKANPNNKLGIFEEGDFYAAEDLIEFFALFAPNIPPTTMPKLEGIDGGFAPGLVAGGESDLDFQISYPII